MPTRTPRPYQLTTALAAAHAGASGVVALDAMAMGRTYALHAERPDARTNRNALDVLAEMGSDFGAQPIGPSATPAPEVVLVKLSGPIEESGGYHDPCGGWTAGHDTISEGLVEAFARGDVVFNIHSPGGAVSCGPENMRRAQEAKARHGRRCIGFSEGMICSMALWWAAAICDELWISADARSGAVGARGMLSSIAGALAKDGITVEVFEDPEGKAAGVPELPIGDEAKARAQRDVTIAADAFRAAVCASAWGMRAGLTPELLKSYRADAFTGQAAADAGFADGVSTLEAVMIEALANAGKGAAMPDPKDDEKDKQDEGAEDMPEGEEPQKCGACGASRVGVGGYCAGCGKAFAEDDEKDPEGDEDKAPDSSARGAALAAKVRAFRAPVPAAARFGGDSIPALRGALTAATSTLDAVARLVGAKTHGEIVGCTEAVARDAANAARYRRERNEQRARNDAAERIDILQKLAAADPKGHPRGQLLVDVLDGDKVGVRPAKLWGDGPEGRTLANLRGYARTVLGSKPEQREPNPFDPPAQPTDAGAANMTGEIEAAKRDPAVILAAKTTPGADIDKIAEAHVLANRAARTRAQVTA